MTLSLKEAPSEDEIAALEEEYIRLLDDLEERLDSGQGKLNKNREKVLTLLIIGVLIASVMIGGWLSMPPLMILVMFFLIMGATGAIWLKLNVLFDPKHDRHQIVTQAQNIVRFTSMRLAHENGLACWEVATSPEKHIAPTINIYWKCFWARSYIVADTIQHITPRARHIIYLKARADAEPAFKNGREMAEQMGIKFSGFWDLF